MKIIIDENSEELRIDSFLTEFLPDFSRAKIQAQIKQGECLVNEKKIKPSYILKTGDIVEFIPPQTRDKLKPLAENIQLSVIWEDENMAVINKYGEENLSNLNGELRLGIVHRLDRNTSGLIMIAKNNKTHEFLVNEMKEKRFSKKYLAVVKGIIEKDEFVIDSPIGRHLSQPHKQCVREDGKASLTLVKVLERFSSATLVELTLVTGRTHQIRVHMASIGHPVFNDTLYGFGKMKIKTEEQVLQSYKLEFTKPFTDERISLEIPKDEKIEKVLKALS